MLVLFLLPIALRLALLPHFPVPTPTGSDDFSHLLVADTLRHFRLANPTHPFHRFFEAIFILQEPTYSSMYPPGQGIVLALGNLLFGTPWAGVLLCGGALCALCYWMLRGWVDPAWAFAGGLLAVTEFGPLNQWMNTYWTSALPAIAGCLVFGALPRLGSQSSREAYSVLRQAASLQFSVRAALRPAAVAPQHAGRLKSAPQGKAAALPSTELSRRTKTGLVGAFLGLGLALHLITRPFEFLMLASSATCFLPMVRWRQWRTACLILLPATALLLFQNHAVTGSWTTLPYQLSRYEYGIPATFVFQPNPIPHRPLTPEQDLNYRAQCAIHGDQPETIGTYLERLVFGMRYYRFFILPPLYLALAAFLATLRERRHKWVATTVALFILACNFYPYFYPHYAGATASLFILMSIVGLQKLNRWHIGRLLFFLCIAAFLCWYGIRLIAPPDLLPALAYDEWDFVNHGDPEGRIAVNDQLAKSPGKQLVFVHYAPQHKFHEWIHNDADIDAARVVWALDLGEEENRKLMAYYPDRHVWMVEPDAQPPQLRTLSY
jgi:hypothetical protein